MNQLINQKQPIKINQSIKRTINQSNNQSINHLINQSNKSVKHPINQSVVNTKLLRCPGYTNQGIYSMHGTPASFDFWPT